MYYTPYSYAGEINGKTRYFATDVEYEEYKREEREENNGRKECSKK